MGQRDKERAEIRRILGEPINQKAAERAELNAIDTAWEGSDRYMLHHISGAMADSFGHQANPEDLLDEVNRICAKANRLRHSVLAVKDLRLNLYERHCKVIKDMPYKDFLRSTYWQIIRRYIFWKNECICYICSEKTGKEVFNVHHRTYEYHGFEHLYLDSLSLVCEKCHEALHGHSEEQAS